MCIYFILYLNNVYTELCKQNVILLWYMNKIWRRFFWLCYYFSRKDFEVKIIPLYWWWYEGLVKMWVYPTPPVASSQTHAVASHLPEKVHTQLYLKCCETWTPKGFYISNTFLSIHVFSNIVKIKYKKSIISTPLKECF